MRLELEKKQNSSDEIDSSCDTQNWLPQLRLPIINNSHDQGAEFSNTLMYNSQMTVPNTTESSLSHCHMAVNNMQLVRSNTGESLDLHYAYRDDYPTTSTALIDHSRLSVDSRDFNTTVTGTYGAHYSNFSSDYCETSVHYQQQNYIHSAYPNLSTPPPQQSIPLTPPSTSLSTPPLITSNQLPTPCSSSGTSTITEPTYTTNGPQNDDTTSLLKSSTKTDFINHNSANTNSFDAINELLDTNRSSVEEKSSLISPPLTPRQQLSPRSPSISPPPTPPRSTTPPSPEFTENLIESPNSSTQSVSNELTASSPKSSKPIDNTNSPITNLRSRSEAARTAINNTDNSNSSSVIDKIDTSVNLNNNNDTHDANENLSDLIKSSIVDDVLA